MKEILEKGYLCLFLSLIALTTFSQKPEKIEVEGFTVFFSSVVFLILAAVYILLVNEGPEKKTVFTKLGLNKGFELAIAKKGLLLWLGVLVFSVISSSALSAGGLGGGKRSFEGEFTTQDVILITVAFSLIHPFAEEVIFRGGYFRKIRDAWGLNWGLILSGIFFGLAHFDAVSIPGLIAFGFLCAWLYEESGSLWAPISLHILNNSLSLVGVWVTTK